MASFKLLLLVLLLDSAMVSNQLTIKSSIIGGESVKLHDFNWMAAIVKKNAEKRIICAGTLLNERWIVTAAHCFQLPMDEYLVRLGVRRMYDNSRKQDVYTIITIIRHPEYSARYYGNDIAVAKLSTKVDLHKDANPIPYLPLRNLQLESQDTCWVAGWGRTSITEDLDKHTTIQEVALPIIPQQTCINIYKNVWYKIRPEMLCAGKKGKNICLGDSGDSLVCFSKRFQKHFFVGVASFGEQCGETGLPAVFTRVSSYLDFIKKHTGRS